MGGTPSGVARATVALREFEKANGRKRTPVIACTASVTKDDREACESADMDDYVSKPVARDVLNRVLLTWLGQPAAGS
ncbi:MAG: hypothetical protein O2973_00360 [Gemmatimonadetes bacterium]|nr:hypothetical protein [Gemmatimonadota bacterium]